ncbi:uncharacterized protein LOC110618825 isoform X1 [Manihot esculenta]|uniref:Uncharacterized protein n=1 Tax=Manihot esculenta TaxID=3983 RepID=A0A2C9WJI9_MANES|nr:uncharacterized protein LOC110618825 isoform X1 [Manihot esculenta]OAY60112.1 hypothetical protein MANES_01G086700v8 [Manihot esculenta]
MESGSGYSSNNSIVVANQSKPLLGIRIENPFTFKVFQVFTGFGFGCGVGIGVGRPVNLGALPMVGQFMSAARGAIDPLSGASRHVNYALRKMGAKGIEVGIGCGVGFGHGFGIGLAVKPGVVQKIQLCLMQVMTKMMVKFGMTPNLSIGQGALPMSLQSGLSSVNGPSIQNPLGSITQLATTRPESMQGYSNMSPHPSYESSMQTSSLVDTPFGRTEKVISSFLHNPILKQDDKNLDQVDRRLHSENNLLQMVLKHQQVIEELMQENEKLRQILVEDLKISPSKLHSSYSPRNKSACADCFECRRKQRKSR